VISEQHRFREVGNPRGITRPGKSRLAAHKEIFDQLGKEQDEDHDTQQPKNIIPPQSISRSWLAPTAFSC
jgi:hypothetical protein